MSQRLFKLVDHSHAFFSEPSFNLRGILFCTKLYLSCQLQWAATTVPTLGSGLKKLADPKPGRIWVSALVVVELLAASDNT